MIQRRWRGVLTRRRLLGGLAMVFLYAAESL